MGAKTTLDAMTELDAACRELGRALVPRKWRWTQPAPSLEVLAMLREDGYGPCSGEGEQGRGA